ncbi:Hsp70 family protein [Kocuria salina]|uniref:Hsp70 family protein n=1 Tax=Kocuria salina TaxID=1929416 RepID=UPI001593FED9|nr:Hsp70 family protein [Kocuria salina]NVC25345.1 Hsp70 family protein [Kocuria salina]
MTTNVIGIDLGTTNSVVATITSTGEVVVLPNAIGDETTPSVVYFQGTDAIVGAEARELAAVDPESGVALVKRHMGSDFPIHVASQIHTPESISAIVLHQLVHAATRSPSPRAVVTVPAYFGTAEREATFQAGRIAGLDIIELLDEPVAAAMHYGLSTSVDRTILVYDLGGGTFDTTVLSVQSGNVTVLATDGHNRLGGADIDERLMELVLARIERDIPTEAFDAFSENPNSLGELRVDIEQAKKSLSQSMSRELRVRTPAGQLVLSLTRDDLADACTDLFSTTLEIIDRVRVAAKNKGVAALDEVIMVGGSSRIPLLLDSLEGSLGVRPRLVEPDLAVAKGSAIRAHQLVGTTEYASWANQKAFSVGVLPWQPSTVTTVSPRAIGVMVDDSFDPAGERQFVDHLIVANTALPTAVTRDFATIVDGQETVRIQVYEQAGAMQSDELEHNRLVVDGELSGLDGLPAGSPIRVTLTVAAGGRISLEATEQVTGKRLSLEAFVAGVVDSTDTASLASSIGLLRIRG